MPKIEVNRDLFFKYIGKKIKTDELVTLLESAKAELDGVDEAAGVLKIELNDTNRPDLWSTMGLARHLAVYLGGKQKDYASIVKADGKQAAKKIVVDKNLKGIRPYIAAFAASGPAIDEPHLVDLIQSQEKLCGNYGNKRKSIAMGVYRSGIIKYPIHYVAADPDKTRFIPLGMEKELSLRAMLDEHPKGVEFGHIVKDFPAFPFLQDDKGEVLSFPPIINSQTLGAVEVGDAQLFVELTGTDIETLLLACSIVACDLSDAGWSIEPVLVQYPYDTPCGREIVTPRYFQKPVSVTLDFVEHLTGERISSADACSCIRRMGSAVTAEKDRLTLVPPLYRNDFLHPVDAAEEIVIGRGLKTFEPVLPEEFTAGRLSSEELFSRSVRDIMVGQGFQEMIYNYLGAKKDFVAKMGVDGDDIIEISNPMSESFEMVRNSIIPNLLASEAAAANAVYPHKMFEAGKIVRRDKADNYGSVTRNCLGFLMADRNIGFNEISAALSAVMFYSSREYALEPLEDPRFISGRAGAVLFRGRRIGVMGEIHPSVLEAWGIQMPCSAAELDLDALME